MGNRVSGVLLTGTIAAGKTTTAEAMSEILHEQGKRHALLELDWLAQLFPAPDDDDPYNVGLGLHNLGAIWPNFKQAGAKFLVLTGTIVFEKQLSELRSALADVDLTICLVTASPEVVADRIDRRNRGRFREDFLARTDELAATIAEAGFADFTIVNEGEREETARAVLDRLGW